MPPRLRRLHHHLRRRLLPHPPLSSDASLSALSLSAGAETVGLAESFAPGTLAYTARVGYRIASLTLVPTVNHAGAAVTVNGAAVRSGQASATLPLAVGETVLEVVVTAQDGTRRTYTVTVTRAPAPGVAFFPSASNTLGGLAWVVNRSASAGTVMVRAFDDAGEESPAQTLTLGAGEAMGFTPADLEGGNADKGLTGTGTGAGDWRLVFESALDLRVLGLVRQPDGGLAPVHDTAPGSAKGGYAVVFFNPASNRGLPSRLRLVNHGDAPAAVSLTGTDDGGRPDERAVTLRLPAGAACTLGAPVLESGAWGDTGPAAGCGSLTGALGDGAGKWRLMVTSNQPLAVMSLLGSAAGRLTNLSSVPAGAEEGVARLALLPPADDALRQGFVRLVNRDARAGTVTVRAIDDAGTASPAQTLILTAGQAMHFNAADLEGGNTAKGLTGTGTGTGDGTGSWRLVFEPEPADLDLQALAYVRNPGLSSLAALHDTAPGSPEEGYEVAFFNPASNRGLLSRLRLVNRADAPAAVTIAGTDEAGSRARAR